MRPLPDDLPAEADIQNLLPPEAWRDLLAGVFARHGLSAAGLAPEIGGSDVVWGTREAVIKLTLPAWDWQIAAEARHAAWLPGKVPLETPPLIATGTLDRWPYVITGRIGGVAVGAVWGDLDHRARRSLAARIGEATAALHAAPLPDWPDTWPAFLAARQADLLSRHDNAPAPLRASLATFLEGPVAPRGGRVMLHTELLGAHIHVAEVSGRWAVSGMLDFADGMLGEPGYDFSAPAEFIFRGEPGLFRAFREGYGGIDAEPEALLQWYLLHRYARLPRLVERVGGASGWAELAQKVFG